MIAWRAMFGRGGEGVPVEPLNFASLALPRSPNACLACPPGDNRAAHEESPVFATDPDTLMAALRAVAAAQPRVHLLADWPALLQAQWVARSKLANFPDVIVAEALDWPGGGSTLRLYSRSLVGWSDLGVNQARVRGWLAALRDEMARIEREVARAEAEAAVQVQPADPPPEPAGTPMERAVARRARGRHVLFAWDDHMEVPELVLRALASGAAEARVAARHRPTDADRLLAEAGERVGLPAEAARVLEMAPCAADARPPTPNHDTSRPRAWWTHATLEEPDIRARLGEVDVAVCGVGLMQWWPDPPRRLRDLRRTGASELVLRTAAVPVTPALEAEGFTPGVAWHAGQLTAARCDALDEALRELGCVLPQLRAVRGPLTRESAAGLDGPWWWFMSEAGVARLLRDAGWEVTGVVADELFPVFLAVRA